VIAPGRRIALGALLAVAACSGTAPAATPSDQRRALPADVRAFVAKRDTCDHFRGEEPYDAARRAEIAKALATNCKGTDAQLAHLRKKYRGQRAATKALAGYEARIE
jgi:cytochrome c556